MSSATIIDTLTNVTNKLIIYFGLFIIITGMFGQTCNVIVFTTLKTFRETTCAFYLTVVSVANFGQALPVLFRVLTTLNVTPSNLGLFCKFRLFFGQFGGLVSLTSMCLTTIDQFLSMTKYRHWNSMSLARVQITFTCIFGLFMAYLHLFTMIPINMYVLSQMPSSRNILFMFIQ